MNKAARDVIKRHNPYEWIQTEKHGEFTIMSGKSIHSGSRWTAWAKKGQMFERQPLAESGKVFLEFGATRQKAIDRLISTDLEHERGTSNNSVLLCFFMKRLIMKIKLFCCLLFFIFGIFTICFNVWRDMYFPAIAGIAMMYFSIVWAKRLKT